MIEIHSDSVEDPPDPEFTEVSVEELHQRGYLTAAEQLSQISPNDLNSVIFSGDRKGQSWIKLWWNGQRIESYCGSRTFTPYSEYIKVKGEWTRFLPTGEEYTSRHRARVDINGSEIDVWWRGGHNPFIFNPPRFFTHRQKGWHQWGRDNQNPILDSTEVVKPEPPPQE